MKYDYDETGANFSYFILSLLILFLVPYTIHFILTLGKGKNVKESKTAALLDEKKKARLEAKKSKDSISIKLFILIGGWILAGLLIYKVMNTEVDYVEWDPYQIMNLKKSATAAEIKKQYKKLGLKFHPDKVDADDKEAENRWIEITKAYKVLTNEEARRNFEEYGHPDGKQSFSLGIALPAWLAESSNSFIVLILYSSVFAIALPFLVHKWWKNSKSYTRDKLLQSTMARFYHEVKEKTPINGLLDIIANSPEYETVKIQNSNMGVSSVEQALTELNDKIKLAMSVFSSDRWDKTKKYRQDNPRAFRNLLLLYAHLFRVQIDNKQLQEEQEAVIETALRLLGGILQIAVAHSWLDVTNNCIELGQLIVQAIPPHQHALFQLPFITPEIIKHCDTKKRKINTIKDLLDLSDEDRRSLLRTLDDEQYNKVVEVAKSFPRVKVTNVEFKVLGEREDEAAIAPGVFVTCFIKLRQIRYDEPETIEGEEQIDTEINEVEEKKKKMRTLFDKATNPNDPIYAPYLMMEKRPGWWLMMGNPQVNKSLTPPMKINDLVDEKVLRFTFQTPPKTGTFPITLYVKSDSSIGFDVVQEVKLVVVPAPKYHVYEDEISEPEEDSLAGQLAAMKQEMANEKKKNAAKKNQKKDEDDDEDSSDYESSEDE
ncbi:hypothetical protein BCR32DRAFT_281697 [Anaeromyces robustus]|uniref:J domain-containing protein n=1 Tax=Anaeromyces robustus TaxID=1754192 RepID=A0A1Y1WZV0_9FUNG|nr:hypothetical protein BCR32DRAFT_281697 [Anaeromyces robustus]|eukprot:ORX79099.1 hypothetical protein BCR32DRAFT_281697 [Anaeromyces robustus]